MVGWFVVAPVAETLPDPDPLEPRSKRIIALAGALLFALVANAFARWWVVVPYSGFFAVLLCVSVIDLRVYRIPDRIVFPALFVSLPVLAIAASGLDAGVWMFMKGALVGMAAYF